MTVPELAAVIDTLGLGWAQLQVLLAAGGVWMADGAEILTLSATADAIAADFGLSHNFRATFYSIVLAGVLVGNLLGGLQGDLFGRRPTILSCYVLVSIASVASACAQSPFQLLLFRFFLGACVGLGIPAAVALMSELAPSRYRVVVNASAQYLCAVGSLFATIAVVVCKQWRLTMCLAALPALICLLFAFLTLRESPHYLAARGSLDGARRVLRWIQVTNGKGNADITFFIAPPMRKKDRRDFWQMARRVFAENFLSTVTLCLLAFFCTFANTALFFITPILAPLISAGFEKSASSFTLFAAQAGYGFGALLSIYLGRRKSAILGFIACTVSAVVSVLTAAAIAGGSSHLLMKGGFYVFFGLLNFCLGMNAMILIQYGAELYPTGVRASGTALCSASGTLGQVVAPLLASTLEDLLGLKACFFGIAAICVLAGLLILNLPETQGEALREEWDGGPLLPTPVSRGEHGA